MSFFDEQNPKTAYGDLATSERTPAVQINAQYGVLKNAFATVGPSGTAFEQLSEFIMTSGSDPNGFGAISTGDRLTFRPGEGEVSIFTARFSAGMAGSEQFGGLANPTDALGFGYNGTEFGVLFRSNGALEIQELTFTTPAAGSENATITIDGTPFTVPLTAGTLQHNADEAAASLNLQVPLWQFTANNDQVIAVSVLAAVISGSFSFVSSTAVAAFAQVAAGVLPADIWTKREDWNVINPSSFTPGLFNFFKIQIGAGVVRFFVANKNTNSFELVHVIDFNNVFATPPLSNFTFGHTWYALNRGGVISVLTAGSSAGLFREGKDVLLSGSVSSQNTVVSVGTTPVPLMTIRNRLVMDDITNLARLRVTGISVIAPDAVKPIVITLARDATLTDPVFQYQDKTGSIAEVDKDATAGSGTGIVLIGDKSVESGAIEFNLRREEALTIFGNVESGAAADFTITSAWDEDL